MTVDTAPERVPRVALSETIDTAQAEARSRPLRDFGLATVIFVALTVVAMWPAFSDLSNTIMGGTQPSDATAGGVRLGWLLTIFRPFGGSSSFLGAPQGMPFWPFTLYTSTLWIVPEWVFAHLAGGIASWNLTTAVGFVLDGLAMFGLVRWLTRRAWLGGVAGLLYAFSPFHVEESYAHVGYVWTWIFPLLVWACLWLARRPSLYRGLLVGALVGIGGYLDPYYLLFGPMAAAVVAAPSIVGAGILGASRLRMLGSYVVATADAVITILPLVALYVTAPASSRWLVSNRTALQATRFTRARLWEYFVPWENSGLWGHWTKGWVSRQLGPVPPIETSLYLGTGVLILAAGLWIYSGSRLFRGGTGAEGNSGLTLPLAFVGPCLFVGALVLMLCSFANLGPLPGFPILIWHILPLWRALSRLTGVIDCFVVVAASLGLLMLVRSRRIWLAAVLGIFAVADGTALLPWQSWSYAANTPAVYKWLAHHSGGIVAEYPMLPPDLPAYLDYNTFQIVHKHRLFNGALPGSLHADVERGVADLLDTQTIPTLRSFSVRYVVLDRPLYDNPPGTVPWGHIHLRGLQPILTAQGLHLYRVLPGPVAPATITVVSGFGVEHPFLPRVERWMSGSQAKLGLDRHGWRGALRVSFLARSYKKPLSQRWLQVTQRGRTVWAGRITEHGTVVLFVSDSSAPLVLHCSPGAVHVPGFLDRRSININRLDVTAVR